MNYKKYTRKETYSAVQFTGSNTKECMELCPILTDPITERPMLVIPNELGDQFVQIGDWIVKDSSESFHVYTDITFKHYFLGSD